MGRVAKYLLAAGRASEAAPLSRQAAEMWEKLHRTDPAGLYTAAVFRAVSAAALRAADKSATAARDADREADRAMAWLRQYVAAGSSKVSQIKEDTDLDALGSRDDFKKLE
jgi:hypothetical protein